MKNFKEANQTLAQYIPRHGLSGEAYKLDRMLELMDKLGNPQEKYRVIHVAGTSGKTSTSYYLASLLRSLGCKTGLTVSPHMNQVNERVQIDMVPLDEETFCHELELFINKVKGTGITPTYFELLVAFAYWYFAKAKVEYAVVEVGLGGKLDGTNVISRPDKICVITDIGLDHTNVLGSTIEEIAGQKAGIIKKGNQVFMNTQPSAVIDKIKQIAEKQSAKLDVFGEDYNYNALPLFQQKNFNLAEGAISRLFKAEKNRKITNQEIEGAQRITIPGRFEKIQIGQKTIILDGAHNYQKLKMLFDSINHIYPSSKISTLASMTNKDNSILRPSLLEIINQSDSYMFTTFNGGQDLPKKSLSYKYLQTIIGKNINFCADNKKAFKILLADKSEILIITGSIYFVSEMRQFLKAPSNLLAKR